VNPVKEVLIDNKVGLKVTVDNYYKLKYPIPYKVYMGIKLNDLRSET
jgi:hypothetical protein